MKILLVITLFFLFGQLLFAQETQIKVDFSLPEYYPLVKNKASIYQEGFPSYMANGKTAVYDGDSLHISDIMSPLKELKVGYFRCLVSQAKDTNNVYRENGVIKVKKTSEIEEFISQCYDNNIIPALTLWQTPIAFRQTIDGQLTKRNYPPGNLPDYGKSMGEYAKLFSNSIPLMWEVWNEPELKIFLDSDDPDTDYNLIYKNVAPEIRRANPDFLIGGPAAAGVFKKKSKSLCEEFISNVKRNELPLDIFTMHAYGRFFESKNKETHMLEDHTDYNVKMARNTLGDEFQTTPIVFTEYDYYLAGANHDLLQSKRELTIGAVNFLTDLKYFISQTDVQAVTWNRYVNRGQNFRKGGLIDHYLNRRPIYYAFQFYGQMPENRKNFSIESNNTRIDGFASANENLAAIMLWNNSEENEGIELSFENIPMAVEEAGYMAVYRIDKNHTSYLENGLEKCFPTQVEKISYDSGSLNLEIPGPGIVYIKFEKDINKEGIRIIEPKANFVRNWQWCGRLNINGETSISGDYGNFDWQNWTANVGVKGEKGRGISGVTLDNTPSEMECSFKTFNVNENEQDVNALVAIRIDYYINGFYGKSVLLHGELFNEKRNSTLPWAGGGSTGTQIVECSQVGTGEKFLLDFDKYANTEWRSSEQRRTTVSFWLENSGIESQATVKLFGVNLSSGSSEDDSEFNNLR